MHLHALLCSYPIEMKCEVPKVCLGVYHHSHNEDKTYVLQQGSPNNGDTVLQWSLTQQQAYTSDLPNYAETTQNCDAE